MTGKNEMKTLKVGKKSDWLLERIKTYLRTQNSPIRLAVNDGHFPLICSLWFEFDEVSQQIICASHKRSALVNKLQKDPNCAFEISANEPPYQGVRGIAKVELTNLDVELILPRLMDRYLGDSYRGLTDWLKSRHQDEFLLRLTPLRISAWDYPYQWLQR
jgi:hypothetical protein